MPFHPMKHLLDFIPNAMLHWSSQRSVLPFVVMNTAKKHCKDLFSKNFVSTFAPSFENDTCLVHGVMVVTTGFGSVSQGSNPCGPTTKIPKRKPRDFLYMYVKTCVPFE